MEKNFLFISTEEPIECFIRAMLQKYNGRFYLSPEELKAQLNMTIQSILAENLDNVWELLKQLLQNTKTKSDLTSDIRLSFEPVG